MKITKFFAVCILAVLATATTAQAQTAVPGAIAPNPAVQQEAKIIANACLADWTTQPCLHEVSAAALVLAANYGAALQQAGHADAMEQIKNHCAASTAATKGNYPAYAMNSAFKECADTIASVASSTGMNPDLNQFQLLVGPVLCLSQDQRCAAVTEGLKKFAGQ